MCLVPIGLWECIHQCQSWTAIEYALFLIKILATSGDFQVFHAGIRQRNSWISTRGFQLGFWGYVWITISQGALKSTRNRTRCVQVSASKTKTRANFSDHGTEQILMGFTREDWSNCHLSPLEAHWNHTVARWACVATVRKNEETLRGPGQVVTKKSELSWSGLMYIMYICIFGTHIAIQTNCQTVCV